MKIITKQEAVKLALKLYPAPEPRDLRTMVESKISAHPDAIADLLLRGEHVIYGETDTTVIKTIAQMRKHYLSEVVADWRGGGALHHAVYITKCMSHAPLGQVVYFGEPS
jgi:hypothetical protein